MASLLLVDGVLWWELVGRKDSVSDAQQRSGDEERRRNRKSKEGRRHIEM